MIFEHHWITLLLYLRIGNIHFVICLDIHLEHTLYRVIHENCWLKYKEKTLHDKSKMSIKRKMNSKKISDSFYSTELGICRFSLEYLDILIFCSSWNFTKNYGQWSNTSYFLFFAGICPYDEKLPIHIIFEFQG